MKQFKLQVVPVYLVVLTALFIPAMVRSQEVGFTFPLSTWSKGQLKAPEAFWAAERQFEKSWPLYISEQEKQFSRIYGNGIKNGYDLFLREQTCTAGAPVIQKKTLKRLLDLVSVPGKSLSGAQGSQISNIRVVAFREGLLRVIPFDILEFNAAGRVVLPLGPEGNPNDGDGILGDNDKILFMAMDAGHKVGKSYITGNLKGVRDMQEIELEYAPANEHGWVYVVSFSGIPPEKSPIRYARHSSEAAIIYTPYYLVQSKPRVDRKGVSPTTEAATWAIAPSMGGDPRDIHEKLALNIKLAYRIGVTTSEDQDSFNMRMRAWYNGDVIVYGRTTWKVKTPLGIGAPTIFADIVATPFYLLNQNFLCTPFDPSVLMKSFQLIIGEDLNSSVLTADSARGYRLITADNRQGFMIDARMDPGEGDPAYKGLKRDLWHVLTGPWGSMCVFSGLNEYLSRHASKFNLLWSDTQADIGGYRYNLEVRDFKNRQEHMYLEWNVVPQFGNIGQYNWNNLDLVIRHHEKPLSAVVNGVTRIPASPFLIVPDIKYEKGFYRY
jgi:hypothetical protein